MEPFKSEQIAALREVVFNASDYVDVDKGWDYVTSFLETLPVYFCQRQMWYKNLKRYQTGQEFSAMVCLKNRAVCNMSKEDALNCCDYLPFGQVECKDETCKIQK